MLFRFSVLLIAIGISFRGVSAGSLEPVGVCYGESLGPKWNRQFEALISEIFTQSGIDIVIKPAPTRRSHTMIRQDQCKIFASVSQGGELPNKDYIRIHDPLFEIELNLYTHPNQPFIYQRTSDDMFKNLSQLDNDLLTIGYFRIGALDQYFSKFTQGDTLSLNQFEQGVHLLQRKRIQFFVTPMAHYLKHEYLDDLTTEVVYVDTLFRDDISFYLHRSLVEHQPRIEATIRRLRKEKFSPILQ